MKVVELVYDAACFVQPTHHSVAHIVLLMAGGYKMLCQSDPRAGKPAYILEANVRPDYLVCGDCLHHLKEHIGVVREAKHDE